MNIFLLLTHLTVRGDNYCRCLSLEGGGSLGAYEAGVIWALANLSNPSDITWNAVSGISIGAINTGILAQFPMGEEMQAAEMLVSLWRSMQNNSQVYEEWPGGLVAGVLFHSSIYNNAPAVKLLRDNYIYPIARNSSVGSTNLDTGLFDTFNESLGRASIDAVICSSSPPFFFPTKEFVGYTWADGGCVMNLDVGSAIERCLEVTDEEHIIADLIYDIHYENLPNDTSFKTPDVMRRVFEIVGHDGSIWFTYNAQLAYPKVNFRYVIYPSGPTPGGIVPLNFTQEVIELEIQMGINDTKSYFNSPEPGRVRIEELYRTSRERFIHA